MSLASLPSAGLRSSAKLRTRRARPARSGQAAVSSCTSWRSLSRSRSGRVSRRRASRRQAHQQSGDRPGGCRGGYPYRGRVYTFLLEDLPDGGGRDLDAEGGELALHAPISPAGALANQAQDEGTDGALRSEGFACAVVSDLGRPSGRNGTISGGSACRNCTLVCSHGSGTAQPRSGPGPFAVPAVEGGIQQVRLDQVQTVDCAGTATGGTERIGAGARRVTRRTPPAGDGQRNVHTADSGRPYGRSGSTAQIPSLGDDIIRQGSFLCVHEESPRPSPRAQL